MDRHQYDAVTEIVDELEQLQLRLAAIVAGLQADPE